MRFLARGVNQASVEGKTGYPPLGIFRRSCDPSICFPPFFFQNRSLIAFGGSSFLDIGPLSLECDSVWKADARAGGGPKEAPRWFFPCPRTGPRGMAPPLCRPRGTVQLGHGAFRRFQNLPPRPAEGELRLRARSLSTMFYSSPPVRHAPPCRKLVGFRAPPPFPVPVSILKGRKEDLRFEGVDEIRGCDRETAEFRERGARTSHAP